MEVLRNERTINLFAQSLPPNRTEFLAGWIGDECHIRDITAKESKQDPNENRRNRK